MLQPMREQESWSSGEGETLPGGDELRTYLLVLKRRLPLILVVAGICLALAALRTARLPSVYASFARLQLSKEAPDPSQAKYVMYWDGVQKEYLNTQLRVLQSMTLALEVVQTNPDIARELEADLGSDDPATIAGAMLGGVVVSQVPDTYLVDVSYESTKSERCARYANAFSAAYLAQLQALWGEKTETALKKFADEAENLRQKHDRSVKELRDFLESNQTPLVERYEELLVNRIQENSSALTHVQRQRIRLDADLEAIQRVLEQGKPLEGAAPIARDQVILQLRTQLKTAELDLATLTRQYGESWPEVQSAQGRRTQLKLQLGREIETIQAQLQSERSAKIAEEKGLTQRARQLHEESRDLARRTRLYEHLKGEVDSNRKFYEELNTRLKEIASYGRVNVTNARVVDPAREAYRVSPNHTRNLTVGLLFGLALGVALALLLERLTSRIRSAEEATQLLNLPVLGVVPEVKDVAPSELDLYALSNSRSVFAEAFRRARVQLNAVGAFPAERCGVLLCSSGVPREGKTLCAVNLAIASAQAGRKTLLIDADMRSPRAHKVFGMRSTPGLGQLLESETLLDVALLSTEVPGLWLLPAGTTGQNPAETLARGSTFADLIGQLRQRFDRIVIDTPPVAAVSDGTLMAGAADAVLLIVSAKESIRSATLLARTELARVGAEPHGLLFNQQGQGDAGYYYYGYYQRYTEPSAMPEEAAGS